MMGLNIHIHSKVSADGWHDIGQQEQGLENNACSGDALQDQRQDETKCEAAQNGD